MPSVVSGIDPDLTGVAFLVVIAICAVGVAIFIFALRLHGRQPRRLRLELAVGALVATAPVVAVAVWPEPDDGGPTGDGQCRIGECGPNDPLELAFDQLPPYARMHVAVERPDGVLAPDGFSTATAVGADGLSPWGPRAADGQGRYSFTWVVAPTHSLDTYVVTVTTDQGFVQQKTFTLLPALGLEVVEEFATAIEMQDWDKARSLDGSLPPGDLSAAFPFPGNYKPLLTEAPRRLPGDDDAEWSLTGAFFGYDDRGTASDLEDDQTVVSCRHWNVQTDNHHRILKNDVIDVNGNGWVDGQWVGPGRVPVAAVEPEVFRYCRS